MTSLGAIVDLDNITGIITVVLLLVAVIAVPRAFTATRQKAELAAKDNVIATREQTNRALADHNDTISNELAETKLSLRRVQSEADTWKARYEEQSKYTAEAALDTIGKLIDTGNTEAQRRHVEVMESLRNISLLVGDERRPAPGAR